jgi:predicted nucleic acid-binding protein
MTESSLEPRFFGMDDVYLPAGGFADAVENALAASRSRSDVLLTTHLSLAEALVGTPPGTLQARAVRQTILDMGFKFVAFDQDAVEPSRRLRTDFGLKPPDSLHLACAAATKTDLFLTNDRELLKKRLHLPGVQFIADFNHPPF